MKKINSHRSSGLASRCVEWFDPNMERTNREAPSSYISFHLPQNICVFSEPDGRKCMNFMKLVMQMY